MTAPATFDRREMTFRLAGGSFTTGTVLSYGTWATGTSVESFAVKVGYSDGRFRALHYSDLDRAWVICPGRCEWTAEARP